MQIICHVIEKLNSTNGFSQSYNCYPLEFVEIILKSDSLFDSDKEQRIKRKVFMPETKELFLFVETKYSCEIDNEFVDHVLYEQRNSGVHVSVE